MNAFHVFVVVVVVALIVIKHSVVLSGIYVIIM